MKESQLQTISEHDDTESIENGTQQKVQNVGLTTNSQRYVKHQKNLSSLEKFDYKTAYSNYPSILSPNTSGSAGVVDYDFSKEIQMSSSVSSSQRFQTSK